MNALAFCAEGDPLPVLPLVLTEVQDLEGLAALDADHVLAGSVDSERPKSHPIHFRPSFSATARVVPEPQKKSATRSPALEETL